MGSDRRATAMEIASSDDERTHDVVTLPRQRKAETDLEMSFSPMRFSGSVVARMFSGSWKIKFSVFDTLAF